MPTVFTHAVVAVSLSSVFPKTRTRSIVITGVLLSIAPDLDVLGLLFGIPYSHSWGHRGMTHSLFFAMLIALLTTLVMTCPVSMRPYRVQVGSFLFLCMASHGVLDMLTNGGLGIALFAPFTETRYFFPYRPLQVSPLGVDALAHPMMPGVLFSEVVWVWLPSIGLALLGAKAVRRKME